MTTPRSDIYQMQVQNPQATMPLVIPVLVLCNTPDEELHRNIKANSAKELPWVAFEKPHDRVAVLVGGGPSVADHLDEISDFVSEGATVFAMNNASRFLRENGIDVDYQVIADAKPETAILVDPVAPHHLFASQADEATVDAVDNVTLWHLGIENMEELFPPERTKRGGYALIGGGAAVGNSATCLAYVMGYRTLHCFGYDSSHRAGKSHAYNQPMNEFIPTVDVEWAGKKYTSSVAMKAQAEKFQITAQRLKQVGCSVIVHGEGLLPAMYNTPLEDVTERDKYRLMWSMDDYRTTSPGEQIADEALTILKPKGLIADFGCGTGRAGLRFNELGYDVILIDFADNCLDGEAQALPFLEWDLTLPCPINAECGFCSDVMEHIPPDDVEAVINNIMASAPRVFFNISTVQDIFGDVIGQRLHLTVKPHWWWTGKFRSLGYYTEWADEKDHASSFLVSRNLSERN